MSNILKIRVTLLSILALVGAISIHYYVKAENLYKVIVPKQTTYYTPGQHDNCKWVVHISNDVTTEPGSNSPIQIGIPEVSKDGYIAGILQNSPGDALLLAFKLPSQSSSSPPVVMTHVYDKSKLPIRQGRFRVYGSSLLTMVLYNSYESCIEASMK
jgi:hypothetical protein